MYEEIPWSPEDQDNYRLGGSGGTWKRHWRGWGPREIDHLWRTWGGKACPDLLECPDCGHPTSRREAEKFQMGKCWNCWKENAYPGFHAKAHAFLRGKSFDDKPDPTFKKLKGDI